MPKPRKLPKMTKSKIQTLDDALLLKLKALYDIENEVSKALPKMAKKAGNPDLKAALEEHLAETENQIGRLEEAFRTLDMKPAKLKSEAIRGLVNDADWVMREKPGKEVLDSLLIASASFIEHYEIAGYTSAIKWARMLGHQEVADLLEETIKEEEMADDKLAMLGDEMIDEAAMGTVDDEEGMAEEATRGKSMRKDSGSDEMGETEEEETEEEE